jgi:hypothetical protein
MAGFNPQQYDQQGSRFSGGSASRRGSFAQYLGGSGTLGDVAGQMHSSFKPPSTTNAQEEQAVSDQQESQNLQQWGDGLNRTTAQQGQFAQLGFGAVNAKQQWSQAKEMAQKQAQASQQSGIFSAISSGIGLLGGFKSAGLFNGGSGGSGGGSSFGSYSFPAAGSSRYGLW